MFWRYLELGGFLTVSIIFLLTFGSLGYIAGYIYRKKIAEGKIGSAEAEAKRIMEIAIRDIETKKKEILLEAKEESIRVKREYEKEIRERRSEISRHEKRIINKEESLDKKIETIDKKEEKLNIRLEEIEKQSKKLSEKINEKQIILEKVSQMTAEEAKNSLLDSVREEINVESSAIIKEIEKETKLTANKRVHEIISSAMQRCDVSHVVETTVSVVSLPSDDMKGRIIGREGRNIRTLEALTGIDLIIDDTPEAVVLSGFSAMRREIARIALEKLISDGRIHPTRIEEMVEKAKKEVEYSVKEWGEAATYEVGVFGLHPELIKLLGKMKFRTSYGQNILKHSIEVSHLCGMIASQMGVDTTLAKRAGLLHDIGKSIDHDTEGTHVTIGIELCKKYRESETIINAIASHHGDVEATNLISVIVQIADAVSASRPGARRETLESYIKRLQKLEEIADSFSAVEKSFAIQAGRELRVILIPNQIDDESMPYLTRQIAKQIEQELEYPGQIKISTIRETRIVDYAK
ncbi:MAG: ribonuclease Y [Defluviitaleaceae bacterium]|nr:ribonuclease Y [Defluviitaleaceae bacterium]